MNKPTKYKIKNKNIHLPIGFSFGLIFMIRTVTPTSSENPTHGFRHGLMSVFWSMFKLISNLLSYTLPSFLNLILPLPFRSTCTWI